MQNCTSINEIKEGMQVHSSVFGLGTVWCIYADKICIELDRKGSDHIWFWFDFAKKCFVSGNGENRLLLA